MSAHDALERSADDEDAEEADAVEQPELAPTGLRPPRQDRSRRSLERVLEAGGALLIEQGYEGFTMADVARRANASVGLIYKRFDSKSALLEAVLLREQDLIMREETQSLQQIADSPAPVAELITRVVQDQAGFALRQTRLTQTLIAQAGNARTALNDHLIEHVRNQRVAPQIFADMLMQRRDEIRHPDPERAAGMAFWLINSALERRVHTSMWRHWDPNADGDWPTFIDDLAYAIRAYLLAPGDSVPTAH